MRFAALAAAVVGLTLLALALYLDAGGWPFLLAFVVAAGAIVSTAAWMLVPALYRLREATAVARRLAAGRFEARLPVSSDAFSPLASALNDAGAEIESVVTSLRQERAQFEALLNASSDATIAVDANGVVVYMNDGARAMFGTADGTGRPFIEVVRDHDLNNLLVAAARRGERSVRVVPYGPAQRWLQVVAVPIEGAGAWAALAVIHDLTEVRRLDSMRRDFVSNVSHELRTPLAGIRAAAETLQEGALEDLAAAREFLGHIQQETDRLTQLVEELLELSRIESGAAPMHFAEIDAADLVGEAVSRFSQQAERAGLSLIARTGGAPLWIHGDAERLGRALGNLVANAIKFTPAGGSVKVSATAGEQDITISVEDTGVGIGPEQRARVFERFYKADAGRGDAGTGLGLAIVKHIVLAHEGSVAVESRPGRGSTFTVRLPRR